MTEEQLKEIEERAARATPGPWDGRIGVGGCDYIVKAETRQDATFIASARTDIPALCAEVRRLQAEQADFLSGVTKRLCSYCGAGMKKGQSRDEHMRSCEKHPLGAALARAEAAERDRDEMRRALALPAGRELVERAQALEDVADAANDALGGLAIGASADIFMKPVRAALARLHELDAEC
jgi:hypothetical protein